MALPPVLGLVLALGALVSLPVCILLKRRPTILSAIVGLVTLAALVLLGAALLRSSG
jgi:hypothetical protein